MSGTRETVRRIRALLHRLRDAERRLRSHTLSGDEYEEIADAVSEEAKLLPHHGIVDALDKAMGRTRCSPWDQYTLLAHALDEPAVTQRIGAWVDHTDPDFQQAALQLIAQKRLTQFAEKLNPILVSGPGNVQKAAIAAAGQLRSTVNLPVLLQLAGQADPELAYPLVLALRNFPHESRTFLERVFHAASAAGPPSQGPWAGRRLDGSELQEFIRWSQARDAAGARRRNSVMAAGGLAKIADQQALAFLIRMLDDPDEVGPNYHFHGQSRDAALALCDAFGWDVGRPQDLVDRVRQRVKADFGLVS